MEHVQQRDDDERDDSAQVERCGQAAPARITQEQTANDQHRRDRQQRAVCRGLYGQCDIRHLGVVHHVEHPNPVVTRCAQ